MDMLKLPGLLTQLVQKIPQEIEAGVAAGLKPLEDRFAALEAKVEADAESALDGKVKAALEHLFGGSFDLSALEKAIDGLGHGAAETETEDKPQESKRADIGSLAASTSDGFLDFSRAHHDPEPEEAKPDPVAAGKKAADDARAAGEDPVAAAARAAFAAVKGVDGFDPVAVARDAAEAEGAGTVEAQRHADAALNEDVASGPHAA